MKFSMKTPGALLLAIALGSSFALFVYGYWLADIFPQGSRRLIAFALLSGAGATAGYYLLFGWLQLEFKALPVTQRWRAGGLSMLLGLILFLAGTSQWQNPNTYIDMFLPTHTLEIEIPEKETPRSLSISWFHTSLGDVPTSTIGFQGWAKEEDQLVLVSPSDNSFSWMGKTGEFVEVVFQARGNGRAILSCDGAEETVLISAGQVRYSCTPGVPWYASRAAVFLLGILNFAALGLALLLLDAWFVRVHSE